MEFRILGPLEVVANGQALDLGGQKQRALLALLLLEANRPVARDRLVDALWEEEPTATAQKALQVYVSKLRKLLGKERVLTQPSGYLLRATAEEIDLARFQQLHAEGELRSALSLWRGAALAEFAHQRFARSESARLEELRLACLEERIDADLAQGHHAEVVAELEALVEEHPLRERFRQQLLLALYRSGRQAEALEAYQAARDALVDELGIEPGRQLRDLQQAILRQDHALEAPQTEASAAESHRVEVPTAGSQAPEPARRGVRKTVTAVSISLVVSSTEGGLVDPETWRQVTTRVFTAAEASTTRHGGTVDSVAGNALTAVFGLPTVHEDDALRAARAAAEAAGVLRTVAEGLKVAGAFELEFRIGISTGEVVTGDVGLPGLQAVGEPLIRSAQLASVAGCGEIVLDDSARRLVRNAVVVEKAADGVWRLADILEATPVRRLASPMVGRERECRRLHNAFEQAVGDRSCQLFTVLGVAGVGKSRLVQEFLAGLADRARVARGRCLPYGQGITYWPLLEAVKEGVGLEDGESPDDVHAKLLLALRECADAESISRRISQTIGLADVAVSAEEGFSAVRELFEQLAQAKPLIVVFDDVHWGEARFLDLVEYVAEWTRDAPILLVCLARPELLELRPGWSGGKLNATTTLLERLSAEESAELIQNFTGTTHIPDPVAARIVDAAEGNPLFVEEMLLMLIDERLLARENGSWPAAGDPATLRVPATIQALLEARLDQLAPDERAVIECAAVAGKVFQEGAVCELAGSDLGPEVHHTLATLVRRQLIRPERVSLGEPTYLFRHLLIRDAAYESIPKEARANLHERFGHWLERTAGDRGIEYEEVVGYHFEQAYRYRHELGLDDGATRKIAREAAERLGRAGRRAFVRSDPRAGINLISRAAALLPRDDPARVELLPNVRAIQGLTGDLRWADRILTEAIEAAGTTGDRRLAATALVQRAFLRLFSEQYVTPEELIDVAQRAIGVFEEVGDELGLARAWRLTAQAHYLGRRAGACADVSERALEHARRAGDVFEQREILEWFAISLFIGPVPASEAERRCRHILDDAARDPVVEVHILCTLAFLVAMQGRDEEAQQLIAQGRRVMDTLGEWIWVYAWHFAAIALWQGDAAAAEQELRPGYESLRDRGEKSHFSSMAHGLSCAAYMQGRYDEAEQLTHECEAAARANDVYAGIIWRSTRAKVLAHKGELKAAEQLARDAVALAEDSDFHVARAEALMDLGEVLGLAAKPESAAAAISEATHFYELKGNRIAAAKARGRLGQLQQALGAH